LISLFISINGFGLRQMSLGILERDFYEYRYQLIPSPPKQNKLTDTKIR